MTLLQTQKAYAMCPTSLYGANFPPQDVQHQSYLIQVK